MEHEPRRAWSRCRRSSSARPRSRTPRRTSTTSSSLSRDADGWVASMALAALAERDDVPDDWVTWAMRSPVRPSLCEDRLLLRALAVHADRPAIGSVLAVLESLSDDIVAEFVADRTARGEVVDASTFDRVSLDGSEALVAVHRSLRGRARSRFPRGLRGMARPSQPAERRAHLGAAVRRAAGTARRTPRGSSSRSWSPPSGRRPPRSVLLVGEHGVGKTALTRAALERIDDDVVVFETTAARLNAGAVYVGELEGRVKTLVDSVSGQRVVWIVPELQETLFAGQHSRSPQGLLDALLPHIESGEIALVAEVTPAARGAARVGETTCEERVRARARSPARRSGHDRRRPARARARRARRRRRRRDARRGARARAAVPPERRAAGKSSPPRPRDRGRGGRDGRAALRRQGRARHAGGELGAAARAARRRCPAAARRRPRLLRGSACSSSPRRSTASSSASR